MPIDTMGKKIRLYDPVAEEASRQETLAQRAGSLEGKVVALLDNTKPLVDTLLDEVKRLFQKDFPGIQFRYFKKDSVSGAGPELMEQLATCGAVVTAIGD
jgi:hypothetical protein